jgi:hypothetical protein
VKRQQQIRQGLREIGQTDGRRRSMIHLQWKPQLRLEGPQLMIGAEKIEMN